MDKEIGRHRDRGTVKGKDRKIERFKRGREKERERERERGGKRQRERKRER